ncbi:TPA: hypothetical protein DCQ44_03230 [Candidatus Taylorbacteria bacterium]|nr:hypothetical protein [Candidatus Taylorbacteria bacterium]
MRSQWAAKRKLVYGTTTFVFLAVLIGVPLFFFLHKTPTCFDGVKNQNEKGVDCGGICTRLCPSDISAPIVLWQRSFQASTGVYSLVAYIQNPNVLSRVDNVGYVFRLYDKDNAMITERAGRTFLPANQSFAVFEAGVRTGTRVPVRTTFEFTESPSWSQNLADYKDPTISAENINLTDGSSPRIDASVHNFSLNMIKTLGVIAIVYDAEDNAITASRTVVEDLKPQSSAAVTFTWPTPFASPVVRKEIILRIYPAGIAI